MEIGENRWKSTDCRLQIILTVVQNFRGKEKLRMS